MSEDFYTIASVLIVAWVLLIYFVISHVLGLWLRRVHKRPEFRSSNRSAPGPWTRLPRRDSPWHTNRPRPNPVRRALPGPSREAARPKADPAPHLLRRESSRS